MCPGVYSISYGDDFDCDYSTSFEIENCLQVIFGIESRPRCNKTPSSISIDLPINGNLYDPVWSNGNIPNLQSLVPCMVSTPTGCVVAAYFTESDDYFYENGRLYIYENLDCSDPNIGYCSDLGLAPLTNDNSICNPSCDEDYVCLEGECIYIGNTAPDCHSTNSCPTGQYCEDGTCTVCPVLEINFQFGNNDDCDFEVMFESSEPILATINAFEDGAQMANWPVTLGISPSNPANWTIGVTQDCSPHVYSFTTHFNGCSANASTSNLMCDTDCITTGGGNTGSLIILDNKRSDQQKNTEEKTSHAMWPTQDILVYPNPFNETVNLEITGQRQINSLVVVTATSKKVMSLTKVLHQSIQLHLKDLSDGIYFVLITDLTGEVHSEKIIKL